MWMWLEHGAEESARKMEQHSRSFFAWKTQKMGTKTHQKKCHCVESSPDGRPSSQENGNSWATKHKTMTSISKTFSKNVSWMRSKLGQNPLGENVKRARKSISSIGGYRFGRRPAPPPSVPPPPSVDLQIENADFPSLPILNHFARHVSQDYFIRAGLKQLGFGRETKLDIYVKRFVNAIDLAREQSSLSGMQSSGMHCFVMALIYLQSVFPGETCDLTSFKDIFTIGMFIAAKQAKTLDEITITSNWSIVSGYPIHAIIDIELFLGDQLDGRFDVDEAELETKMISVLMQQWLHMCLWCDSMGFKYIIYIKCTLLCRLNGHLATLVWVDNETARERAQCGTTMCAIVQHYKVLCGF